MLREESCSRRKMGEADIDGKNPFTSLPENVFRTIFFLLILFILCLLNKIKYFNFNFFRIKKQSYYIEAYYFSIIIIFA